MTFNQLIALDKESELFKVVNTTQSGIIAESITDGKRMPITGDLQTITVLYHNFLSTVRGRMSLISLLKKMNLHGVTPEENADIKTLKEYFATVCPELDEKHFHHSHMRQIISWYDQLKNKLDFSTL